MDDLTTDLPQDPRAEEVEAAADAQAGRRMAFGAIIISFFLFLGKISGYAKSMLIAGWFGGAKIAQADAYNNVYNVIVYAMYTNMEKILRPAYLPQFIREMRSGGEQRAWRLLSVILNLELVFLLVLTAALELLAPQIIRLLWSRLASEPDNFATAVLLLRFMAPATVFLSLSLMPELTLHAYKRFSLPAFGEFAFRTMLVIGMVVGVLMIWRPDNPRAILGAALGVILGAVMRLATMVPGLWSRLRYYCLLLNPRGVSGAAMVFSLMPPVLVGMIASALRGVADSIYADRIGEGMYTCLTFGRQMGDSSLQILPLAVSFVVYPFLSEWAARGEKDKLAEALVGMTRVMAFIFVPISVGLMFLARPIITIMFEHGELTPERAGLSALALFCYAPGLLFFALEGSINKWFFALQDTKTPNYWGAAMAGLHVLIGYVGVMVLYRNGQIGGAGALAAVSLALTVSKSLKVAILYGLIRRQIGRIDYARALSFAGKLGLATAAMGLTVYCIGNALEAPLLAWTPPLMANKLRSLALFGAVGLGGGAVFLTVAAVTRIEELATVGGFVVRKVRGRLAR